MKNLVLLLFLLSSPASAQGRMNVLETLTAALASDKGYTDAERARILEAIQNRFADYGVQIVDARRQPAISVVLHVITEGSFDEAPADRVAEVAFAAYQAVSRGSDPEVIEGIALYGYRKDIPGDRLVSWATGFKHLTDNRIPKDIAADLVRVAMEKDLLDAGFNILKWALVDGVKKGHDPKAYATYLFGNVFKGKSPGRVAGDAAAIFSKAKKEKRQIALPPYNGVFPPPAPAVPPTPVIPSPPPAAQKQPSITKPSVTTPVQPYKAPTVERAPAQQALTPFRELWAGLESSARSYLGTPYVWGGTTRYGIDCSAFTQNTYSENTIRIPRVSRDQWRTGSKTEAPALRNGDLIFFNTMGIGVSHVGMIVDA